jgi:hypothetical protein
MNKWRLVRNTIWCGLFGLSALFHTVTMKLPFGNYIPTSEHMFWAFVNAAFLGMLLFRARKPVVTYALGVHTVIQFIIHFPLWWNELSWGLFDLQSFLVMVGLVVIWFFHLTTTEEP